MTVGSQLGRPVGANGEQTRRRIIAAAMRCVAEVGYSQASIREIARAADMTSGSLYHYFPNKADCSKPPARRSRRSSCRDCVPPLPGPTTSLTASTPCWTSRNS